MHCLKFQNIHCYLYILCSSIKKTFSKTLARQGVGSWCSQSPMLIFTTHSCIVLNFMSIKYKMVKKSIVDRRTDPNTIAPGFALTRRRRINNNRGRMIWWHNNELAAFETREIASPVKSNLGLMRSHQLCMVDLASWMIVIILLLFHSLQHIY